MKKVITLLIIFGLCACSTNKDVSEPTQENKEIKEPKQDEIVEVSFSAVGDNLLHDTIYYYNQNSDGSYNVDYMYESTNYLTQEADISYINLETLCAGESLGLSGYPTFNAPHEMLDVLHRSGFNWFSTSSNHSMDRGEEGIVSQLTYLEKYPDITTTGTQKSIDDNRLQVKEVNGVKVGMNSYTYGLNGFELPASKEYLVNLIDKEQIKEDIEELNKISDIQVISMHWGEEYQFVQSAEQEELAQYLSDLGVDVIIGGHPHVIQPMDYLTGEQGNETLVMYSLGNFISAQDESERMLGGMSRFKIVYNKTKDEFTFKDVEFWPTITFIGDHFHTYGTYSLKDYTDELANKHMLHVDYGQDVSRQYFIDLVEEVMNDKVKIVY